MEYMGKEQPDLLLFDNRLAGKLNGIEAVCLIHGKKDVPVIFITGYQFEDFVEKARTAKPIACLSKPLKFPELQATIDSFFHL